MKHLLCIVAFEVHENFQNKIRVREGTNQSAFPMIVFADIFQDVEHGELLIIDSIDFASDVLANSGSVQKKRCEMRTSDNQWISLYGYVASLKNGVMEQRMIRISPLQRAVDKDPVRAMLDRFVRSHGSSCKPPLKITHVQ